MYLVVSTWEPIAGYDERLDEDTRQVRAALRKEPGVVFVEAFRHEGKHIVVHGYTDEAAYTRVQNDADSAFAKAYREHGVEQRARWLGSLKGETLPNT